MEERFSNQALAPQVTLRSPDTVMRLKRMGSFFPTRLSFLRSLLRKLADDGVRLEWPVFEMNEQGYGDAVISLVLDGHSYSLVAFSDALEAEARTDRVIATAWDACFVLYDGVPTAQERANLRLHTTKQEAGRYDEKALVLSRANKSVRLFEHVADALSHGQQPNAAMLQSVGYLMRTTAVYGNGKFGIADRSAITSRPGLSHPFRLEMLTVYLIREFTLRLVEHVGTARAKGQGTNFAPLDASLKRQLGVGNSTGLGMAPFLVSHPALINNWMMVRETAIARVRAIEEPGSETIAEFQRLIVQSHLHLKQWNVDDEIEQRRIETLRSEWVEFAGTFDEVMENPKPWDVLVTASKNYSIDVQELLVALVLEPHGALVDGLCDCMEDVSAGRIDARQTVEEFSSVLQEQYQWALDMDLSGQEARSMVWYVSEDKAEPRFGKRQTDSPDFREMPHHIVHKVQALMADLEQADGQEILALFMMGHPEHRDIIRRVQIVSRHPYGEIRDNLVASSVRPIDLLRCKLSFFGASNFDPRSDRWTRITLFKGAPVADELNSRNAADVFLPAFPV